MAENLPAIPETWAQSLGWVGPLEKEMANHSNILAWRIPWREEPGGLPSMGLQKVGHYEVTNTHQKANRIHTWQPKDPYFISRF